MKGIPHYKKMAISQCLTRGSNLTCTTCWGEEVSGTVVATGDGAPVAVLSKFGGVYLIQVRENINIEENSHI